MSRDNFSGGFFLGTLVGGLLGGLLGAAMASGRLSELLDDGSESSEPGEKNSSPRRSLKSGQNGTAAHSKDIESARRSLEEKIAQLNETIDDVRQQLGSVPAVPPSDASSANPEQRSS